jgi:signal transduction histidine kinase
MGVAARITTEIDIEQRTADAFWDRVGIALAALALCAGTLVASYCLILGLQWNGLPFPGALINQGPTIAGARPLIGEKWSGLETGLQPGDRVLTVDGVSVQDAPNPARLLNDVLSRHTPGQAVTFEVVRTRGGETLDPRCMTGADSTAVCRYDVTLGQMPLTDFLVQFGIGVLTGAVLLVVGTIVLIWRTRQAAGRILTTMCAAGAVVAMGRFETLTTNQTNLLMIGATCILFAASASLALVFPYPLAAVRRQPSLRYTPLLITIILITVCVYVYINSDRQTGRDTSQLIANASAALGGVFFIGSMLIRRRRAASPAVREQAGIVLIGATVALVPVVLWLATIAIERLFRVPSFAFSSVFVVPPAVVFPLSIAYALLEHRHVDSERVISDALIYAALGTLLVIGYLLITGAAFALTAGVLKPDNPLLIAGTLFLVAVLFTPARLRMEHLLDRAFFRQRRLYEKRLEQFARDLTITVEANDVIGIIRSQLDETIAPLYVFVFLRNPTTGEFEATTDPTTGKPQPDIRFRPDGGLVSLLDTESSILHLEAGDAPPVRLLSDRSRLAVLNTPVIARLRSARQMIGFIALGPRHNRVPYTHEELRFLEGLSGQSAAAFERAQMIIEAQKNARELQVLSQVSTALNIAMDFDTLLEFIYAQVDKVIPSDNFYIALRDTRTDELTYAFYQEDGERVPEREGFRWRMGRDLMSEIVRTQQPIKTENYVQEMMHRDNRARIENPNLRAWVGVPLSSAEGQALGCLALATTNPTEGYTEDQVRIFWHISELAATAIYKTRLFNETEERARQMNVLNEISNRLAGEFQDLDALLQIITESAVEILGCEAGSLLLKDDETGDLIFRLAVGGFGQELVGSRIPAGSGIAGSVVSTGKHMIVKEAQSDARWFGDLEKNKPEQRKFRTNAILAVPLTARGVVLGVLEVINKRGGRSFIDEDVNLLTTFAGQAAIAIDNARVYQKTDEALSERVRQLDNMQRIDQELNRTLDPRRVVDLTIDNALRESDADAGVLVLVDPDQVDFLVAGSVGYPDGVYTPGQRYDITYGLLGKVYSTGQAAVLSKMELESDRSRIEALPSTRSQLAVPMITGEKVTGVLMLESLRLDSFNMMVASHIQGLAEHANTAITNAQLFSRLGEANQARSRFVGFVAHELKNPMTSIKGYAEVLLGGMTGQLTEQQRNFIAVIRQNVVRVQQLVTDLNDLTAQETGNLKLTLAPVSFNNVVLETLRPQQRAIDDKEQKVEMEVPENLPAVWADELRLIQVLTNFISNANKYTPPSGMITVRAEATSNGWDPDGAPEVIHCAIVDTGIGMTEEELTKLGTAYWRSDNPRAREQPGTGLGMTLTKGLIEAHGGQFWVESTLNVGTTFHFTVRRK